MKDYIRAKNNVQSVCYLLCMQVIKPQTIRQPQNQSWHKPKKKRGDNTKLYRNKHEKQQPLSTDSWIGIHEVHSQYFLFKVCPTYRTFTCSSALARSAYFSSSANWRLSCSSADMRLSRQRQRSANRWRGVHCSRSRASRSACGPFIGSGSGKVFCIRSTMSPYLLQ